jgi:hypothetical protein
MPRKLKTYITSAGFFEQAIAAPSMKAAIDAWGSAKNIFHQGFAEETDDPAIIAATMAKPGVVLKRAVGSNGAFTENADLPRSLPAGKPIARPKPKPKQKEAKTAKAKKGKSADVVSFADAKAAKQAAALYEKERVRREKVEAREEAKQEKERERRAEAIANAEAVLDKAQERHDAARVKLADEREELERREAQEEARWEREKKNLQTELKRAED